MFTVLSSPCRQNHKCGSFTMTLLLSRVGSEYRRFSTDLIVAMLVHRTKEKKIFWQFDSIIMQNKSHNLLLFYSSTRPSYHVIENHL